MASVMDHEDIAWLTGIFEGEGSIVLPSAQPNTVTLQLFMTDEDIILRVAEVTGAGNVGGPYQDKRSNHKPIFKWCTTNHSEVARLLLAMYPLLGERRRAKVAEAVNRLKGYKRGHRGYCARGHSYVKVNSQGNRMCQECWNEKQRVRRALEKQANENSHFNSNWRNQIGL